MILVVGLMAARTVVWQATAEVCGVPRQRRYLTSWPFWGSKPRGEVVVMLSSAI